MCLSVCIFQDRKQPDVCDSYFHDVPFEANFASDLPELHPMAAMPGVDGFTMKVDALYKVWDLPVSAAPQLLWPRVQMRITLIVLLMHRLRRDTSGTCRSSTSSRRSRGPARGSSAPC